MKIAFFCDAYLPTRSGVAVSVSTTAEELRARGHEVTIFAPRYNARYGGAPPDPNIVRFSAFHWFRSPDFPVAYPLLPRANFAEEMRFAREKFDIVHSHSPFTIGMLGARWARRHNVPLVFTFHTLYHRYLHYIPAPHTWTRSGVVAWGRYYCGLCDHILTPSKAVSHIVARLRPHVPRSVLPTGVDVPRFQSGNRDAIRKRLGLQADEVALLYVGRIVEEKNLVFLMRALAPLLQCEYSKARLVMVGGGPDFDTMQNVAHDLGIAEHVIWTGFVDPFCTPDYYAAGDVFVFASRTETQGLSIAEALAAGLPCVVVNAMGAAECLTDGVEGFVVSPNEGAFKVATEQLVCEIALRKEMADAARKKAESLSRERRVDELLQIYQQLVEHRSCKGEDLGQRVPQSSL